MNIPANINPVQRADNAEEYFRQGYNCCQSVVMAFSDITGMTEKEIARITVGFGGGMGRLREVCGAFSGCVLMAGMMSPTTDPSDKEARKNSYALVQEMAAEFKTENGGSIICRELLGLEAGTTESPTPSARDAAYYKKRPCSEIVRTAARIVAEKIQSLPYSE